MQGHEIQHLQPSKSSCLPLTPIMQGPKLFRRYLISIRTPGDCRITQWRRALFTCSEHSETTLRTYSSIGSYSMLFRTVTDMVLKRQLSRFELRAKSQMRHTQACQYQIHNADHSFSQDQTRCQHNDACLSIAFQSNPI